MTNFKYIFFILLFINSNVYAGRIKTGFSALNEYNYFKAKEKFEKARRWHPVAANYGLSQIYLNKLNPFHQIDSAYNCILISLDQWSATKERKKKIYSKYKLDSNAVIIQRNKISNALFKRAINVNTEFGFQDFIKRNPWSKSVGDAKFLRDSLFYLETLTIHNSESFKTFIDKYPNSYYNEKAKKSYESQLYIEHTYSNHLDSYVDFIKNFPLSPYVVNAEKKIYDIVTNNKKLTDIEKFINNYPYNSYHLTAWHDLYQTYLNESVEKNPISSFLKKYPDSPHKKMIEEELFLFNLSFYPVRANKIWGIISRDGLLKHKTDYNYIDEFSEGLAAVSKGDKFGYLNKSGNLVIDLKYDDAFIFSQGRAVVEQDGKFGLINRQGEFIIKPIYEFLGVMNHGIIVYEENGTFGYLSKKGNVVIPAIFIDAYDFENGSAKVKTDKGWGLINSNGEFLILDEFESIELIDTNTFAVKANGLYGAINNNMDTIVDIIYDYIGSFNSGYAIVSRNDSFNFINHENELLFKSNWQMNYPEYKILAKFDNKPILIKNENGYNYLKLNGLKVFKYEKENLGVYSSLISFSEDNKWGYLSPSPAKEVFNATYSLAFSFNYNYGLINTGNYFGLINDKEEIIIDTLFDELKMINDTILIAKKAGLYGVIKIDNSEIIPFNYQSIEIDELPILKVVDKETVMYYNLNSNFWLKLEK